MDKQPINANQIYGFLPTDIKGVDALARLALDMRWSWSHTTDELWELLDAELWELTHNPWVVLQTVSRDKLAQQLSDSTFLKKLNKLVELQEQALSKAAWFQQRYPKAPLSCVAYFSMEFMLSEALPIYAGGLGNVAGDQLKSASDLGVPIVGIGLLYQQGYFRQEIDKYGNQQVLFSYNDPGQLPITPARLPNGEWLRIKIMLSGHPVWLRVWQAQVGRVKLYLLDSNDAANLPVHHGITNQLYGGSSDLRIKQEIILGIGGWKLLRALGIQPEVCHLNEGHAAFLVLERAKDFRKATGISFAEALAVTRAGNLFTTHTAVAAGFDHFSPSQMEQFFGTYAKTELGIDFEELMALGRNNPNNELAYFNMAYLAIRGSGAVNGVSQLHGTVSRQLFAGLFPRCPIQEVPIGHVTNGVHTPSWDSKLADDLWTNACGKDRWRGELKTHEQDICEVSDTIIWKLRNNSRNDLVHYIRKRLERQFTIAGDPNELIETAKQVFNPATLTLGFARRFVPYKRPNLLLHDPQRLIRILTNPERPVQLVIAGKAPPFDDSGKALIKEWVQFIQMHHLYHHVVFLSDYDMSMAENLVQGVDVWMNTPRRPWEACGTSGMKVLVNGGLNLSELDGWWAEAYSPEVGWALGDGQEHREEKEWDAKEANTLYELLEQQVIPEFYTRNKNDIPLRWTERVRKSMAILTPQFSANRTVREYTEKYYLPAATNYLQRAANKGMVGTKIVSTHQELKSKWAQINFRTVQSAVIENGYLFQVTIWLNGIHPNNVSLELYADGLNGTAPERIVMKSNLISKNGKEHLFHTKVMTKRPASDYTARVIPHYEGLAVPLEDNLIFWER